jgi:hypothetical protein
VAPADVAMEYGVAPIIGPFLAFLFKNIIVFSRGFSRPTLWDGIVSFDGCGVAESVGLLIQDIKFLKHVSKKCHFNTVTVAFPLNGLKSWIYFCHELGVCVYSSKVLGHFLVPTSTTYKWAQWNAAERFDPT